ncbi:MAG: anti-sigma factor [Corynebacterium sp.]|uniref:anti-sigma factor n=1 Tax=Corynebacterium sp. TaxID=1720 RepID=UPI0026DC62EC|nr:anti-sigma factor [Corynebacterium sp.]MDO5099072.1 anti-sigma factor [Corynebacterium sp.]
MADNTNDWLADFDDSELTEEERRDLADALALSAVPLPPSAGLKADIFAAIENVEQQPAPVAEVIPIQRYRPRRMAAVTSIAAAVVLIAAAGVTLPKLFDAPTSTITTNALSGVDAMHEIMDAADVQSANMDVSGVQLHVVSSNTMDKAGAMVQGAPTVKDGMGVQVWSVTDSGKITSAGVIGPEDHTDVWMPFSEATTKVILTEEPLAGSEKPTGAMIGEMKL